MINALNHLTNRDKRALAIFVGLAILCSFYFASGILVTYVSQPPEAMEVAKDGKGFTVRVLGLQTLALAERLSAELMNQHGVPAEIEAAPTGHGFLIKIGPLVKSSDAETLKNKLRDNHHSLVRIVQNCGPGISDCGQKRQSQLGASSNPNSNQAYDQRKP
ncbi:MAG: SPOR domain-containing protein [Blastocatellia bacterium]